MKTVTGLYFLATIVLLTACYTPRYMYSPAAQNVPVLVKAGDSKLAANYSSDLSDNPFITTSGEVDHNKSEGYDLQGAVAITDHFAIQGQYFRRNETTHNKDIYYDSSAVRYKRELTEFGIGYFRSMHRRDKIMFQVFAGVGKGHFSFIDIGKDQNSVIYHRFHQADVLKIYIQPAFQFRIRDNFALAISTRFSTLKFSHIKTDYSQTELDDYHLDRLEPDFHSFWEPCFTNTFGFNKLPGVKFEYQFGTSVRVSERVINYRSFNFSAGVMLDIPRLFKSSSAD